MQNKRFCSADDEYVSMLDVYNSNVSNPKVRRAELMVRIKGTEEYSQLQKH
ncbi:replication endonuclease [Alteromonas sp. PRIM-21]|nr:replication endonuclease [Alteromonas sp. PRIM-21]